MIDEIKFNDELTIYRTNIKVEEVETLLKDIRYNLNISNDTTYPSKKQPGIQSTIFIETPTIKSLREKIIETIFTLFGYGENTPYFTKQWSYISSSKNNYLGWHDHKENKYISVTPKWTYTYYVQMPDNLDGQDGKLLFKTSKDEIFDILPQEGDLIIFPATVLHAPMLNTHSTKDRVVYAGVFSDIDTSIQVKKEKKSII